MKLSLLILAFLIAFSSCQLSPIKGHFVANKLDTVGRSIYKIRIQGRKDTLGPFMDTAINQIVSKLVLTDTEKNSGAHWETDTMGWGRVSDDTLRGPDHKPLYDSLKHARIHYSYYPILPKSLVPYPR